MLKRISGTIYQNLADDVVRIHTENEVKISGNYDSYGINEYRKSEGGIEVSFYWDGLDEVRTPDGSLSFGSKSGMGGDCFSKTKEALIEYFGLEFVKQHDGMRGERWFIYRATKNIPL